MKRKRILLVAISMFYIFILFVLLSFIAPSALNIIRVYLTEELEPEIIVMLFIVILLVIPLLLLYVFLVYNRMQSTTQNIQDTFVAMSDARSYLEQKINELNDKLVLTDERWQEAYHLILSAQSKQTDSFNKISSTLFLTNFGINCSDITIEKSLVFVLTPFHSDFLDTYNIIKETCTKMDLTAKRGDEIYVSKDVLQHIISNIVKARVIVANLDGRNPNVFYELGIAHALNKPIVLLAHRDKSVPFDLQNKYLVLYKDDTELKERLEAALLDVLTLS